MATGSATDRLAVDGGTPVRDIARDPWPSWPANTEEEWGVDIEPALRDVYFGGVEGLASFKRQEFEQAFAEY